MGVGKEEAEGQEKGRKGILGLKCKMKKVNKNIHTNLRPPLSLELACSNPSDLGFKKCFKAMHKLKSPTVKETLCLVASSSPFR